MGLTFDALDRMVEQNRSGSYTQIVYGPSGGGGGGGAGWVSRVICGPTGHLAFDWQTFTTCLEVLEFGPVAATCLATAGPCAAAIVAAAGSGGALSPVLTICAPAAASCGVSAAILVGCGIHATHCEPNAVVPPPRQRPSPSIDVDTGGGVTKSEPGPLVER